MDKDKQMARDEVRALPVGEKIKHYAYYYKVHAIIAVLVILLLGLYIYQRVTATPADLTVSVFSEEYITIDGEEKMEALFGDFISGDEEKIADVVVTTVAAPDGVNLEKISMAYQKLDGQLAAGTVSALIFDEATYENVMSSEEYASIMLKEYSGEIGEGAKARLGLSQDIKYYYVTRILYRNEEDDEDAKEKQQNAMTLYLKIEELN